MNDQRIRFICRPSEFYEDFQEFLTDDGAHGGSLKTNFELGVTWPPSANDASTWSIDALTETLTLPRHFSHRCFTSSEVMYLTNVYSKLYSLPTSDIDVTRVAHHHRPL